MNQIKVENLVTTTQIADVVGVGIRAVRTTYLNNPKKKEMTKALAIGTYFIQMDASIDEVKLAASILETIKESKNS